MNVESDDWQVDGNLIYKLFTDKRRNRCNKFTIQISSDREITARESEILITRIADFLKKEDLP